MTEPTDPTQASGTSFEQARDEEAEAVGLHPGFHCGRHGHISFLFAGVVKPGTNGQ